MLLKSSSSSQSSSSSSLSSSISIYYYYLQQKTIRLDYAITLPNTSNKHKHTFKYTRYTNDIQIYIAASHYNEFKFTENENVHVIYAWISLEFFVLASIRFSLSFPNTIFGFFHIVVFSFSHTLHFTSLPFHFAIKLFDRYFGWCATAIVIESFWLKTHTGTRSHAHTFAFIIWIFTELSVYFFLIVIIHRSSSSSSFEMEGRKRCHMHEEKNTTNYTKIQASNEREKLNVSEQKGKKDRKWVCACVRAWVCVRIFTLP